MLQASSIFPRLKDQGFHITVMTTPKGKDILINNPYVDEFILQDTDQVPNNELRGYWDVWTQKFTKFINLSESVETNLLPNPGQSIYHWPKDLRHEILNVNYMERTHKIAKVPGPYEVRFYPAKEETEWAKKEKAKIGGYVIMWTLAG